MEIDDDLNDDQKKALYKNDCFLFASNSIICSIIILWSWTWFCSIVLGKSPLNVQHIWATNDND